MVNAPSCRADLLWEHKLHLDSRGPVRANIIRFFNIVEGLELHIHRLLANVEYPAETATDWDRPFVVGLPVRHHDWRAGEVQPPLKL